MPDAVSVTIIATGTPAAFVHGQDDMVAVDGGDGAIELEVAVGEGVGEKVSTHEPIPDPDRCLGSVYRAGSGPASRSPRWSPHLKLQAPRRDTMAQTMVGAVLPGNSTVELREFPVPAPGTRQVLLEMKASTICGSDIRAIYKEHLGKGAEAYQNVICGHEPAGQVINLGPGVRRFREGDRVLLYHISGCGLCHDCRIGYPIGCTGPTRAAYGWQRDGGNAQFCLAEEADCLLMPDSMSYIDGASIACGFGTCYEAVRRIGVSGDDIALIVGLGPMGLASLMLARARGATTLIGVDISAERVELAHRLGLADLVIPADEAALERIRDATDGQGCEVAIDCSGSAAGRALAIRGARRWGRIALVGEGGSVSFEPSPDLIHDQKVIHGSWVTSLGNMEDLVERMPRWEMHPDAICTHRFPLEEAAEAYRTMAEGKSGKVAIVFGD